MAMASMDIMPPPAYRYMISLHDMRNVAIAMTVDMIRYNRPVVELPEDRIANTMQETMRVTVKELIAIKALLDLSDLSHQEEQ